VSDITIYFFCSDFNVLICSFKLFYFALSEYLDLNISALKTGDTEHNITYCVIFVCSKFFRFKCSISYGIICNTFLPTYLYFKQKVFIFKSNHFLIMLMFDVQQPTQSKDGATQTAGFLHKSVPLKG
jgi:hypothetical protein